MVRKTKDYDGLVLYRGKYAQTVNDILRQLLRKDAIKQKRDPTFEGTPEEQYPFAIMTKLARKGIKITEIELAGGLNPIMLDRNGYPNYWSQRRAKSLMSLFNYDGQYGIDIQANPVAWKTETGKVGKVYFLGLAKDEEATRMKHFSASVKKGWERKEKRMEYYEKNGRKVEQTAKELEKEIWA